MKKGVALKGNLDANCERAVVTGYSRKQAAVASADFQRILPVGAV